MKIDFTAMNPLNLIQNSEGHKDGTLYALLDETKSAIGSRKLKELICKPLKEGKEIIERLEAVTELRENLELANLFQYKLQNVIPPFICHSQCVYVVSGSREGMLSLLQVRHLVQRIHAHIRKDQFLTSEGFLLIAL